MNDIEEHQGENPIKLVDDKSTALYAHNVIRKLHGVPLLEWDDGLAEQAAQWAYNLAKTNSGLLHSSPLINYGENIYISKGTLDSSRAQHALLLWYKGIEHYDYQSPAFNLSSGSFSQIVWKETEKVGVGIAYREVSRTTYIVAQYFPPGNKYYEDSYVLNVTEPNAGLPAKIPKIEDFILYPTTRQSNMRTDVSMYGLARGMFRTICKWCSFSGPKPVESWSSTQTDPEKRYTRKKKLVRIMINLEVETSQEINGMSKVDCCKVIKEADRRKIPN